MTPSPPDDCGAPVFWLIGMAIVAVIFLGLQFSERLSTFRDDRNDDDS